MLPKMVHKMRKKKSLLNYNITFNISQFAQPYSEKKLQKFCFSIPELLSHVKIMLKQFLFSW